MPPLPWIRSRRPRPAGRPVRRSRLILAAVLSLVAAVPASGADGGAPVAHVPVAVAYYGQPVAVEARATCANPSCAASLGWATSGHPWQEAAMAPGAAEPLPSGGFTLSFAGSIPATDTTTEGVDYRITLSDGTGGDVTPTYHVTVLAPTAVLHAPMTTTFPGRAVVIDAVVACATSACDATLSYRVPGQELGADPPFSTVAMAPVGSPTSVGAATTVRRYSGVIPAEAVTTRGVDYFLRATDGHTTAYSPGTAYTATAFTRTDGSGIRYFHVHTAEPVHVVHTPVLTASYRRAQPISATVNCATRDCSGTLSYRRTAGLTTFAGLIAYLDRQVDGQPGFTEVPMVATVLADLGDAGTVLRLDAEVPADDVTTDGFDYSLRVSDGATSAYWPGTSYVGGASVDGQAAGFIHVEVPLRDPVRAIAHAPAPAVPHRTAIPIRFVAHCTADRPCTPTVWYRSTPNTGVTDVSQILPGEPAWATLAVQTLSVQPNGTGILVYVFQAEVPADAVDSRGVDYLIKVSNGTTAAYWPEVPGQAEPLLQLPPLLAQHVSVLSSPVVAHTPAATAVAGAPVTLTWQAVCAVDSVEECRTGAAHRRLASASIDGSLSISGFDVTLGTPHPFDPLATTTRVLGAQGSYVVLEASATFVSGPAGGFEQWFIWAGDGHTSAYSPGTTYQGAVLPLDGANLGTLAPWTAVSVPPV